MTDHTFARLLGGLLCALALTAAAPEAGLAAGDEPPGSSEDVSDREVRPPNSGDESVPDRSDRPEWQPSPDEVAPASEQDQPAEQPPPRSSSSSSSSSSDRAGRDAAKRALFSDPAKDKAKPNPLLDGRGPDYYDRRAKELLDQDASRTNVDLHPLMQAHPDSYVVVCTAGCRSGSSAEIVSLLPKRNADPAASPAPDKPRGSDAISCVGGCGGGPSTLAAKPPPTAVAATIGEWMTTVAKVPADASSPVATAGGSGDWMSRINQDRAVQPKSAARATPPPAAAAAPPAPGAKVDPRPAAATETKPSLAAPSKPAEKSAEAKIAAAEPSKPVAPAPVAKVDLQPAAAAETKPSLAAPSKPAEKSAEARTAAPSKPAASAEAMPPAKVEPQPATAADTTPASATQAWATETKPARPAPVNPSAPSADAAPQPERMAALETPKPTAAPQPVQPSPPAAAAPVKAAAPPAASRAAAEPKLSAQPPATEKSPDAKTALPKEGTNVAAVTPPVADRPSAMAPAGPKDGVISVLSEDKDMNAAIAKARASMATFWKSYEAPAANETDHALKVAVPGNGTTEHFWLTRIKREGDKLSGVISNQPQSVKSVKMGQRYEFTADMVSDWTFKRNGKLVGNETMRVLLPRMPEEQAAVYRQMYETP